MKLQELFTNESTWTQGAQARDIHGMTGVCPQSREAVSWCLAGGAARCYGEFHESSYYLIIDKIYDEYILPRNILSLVEWNDAPERSFQDIRDLIETLDI